MLPEARRFVPDADVGRLRADVGEAAVLVVPGVGHSIHRDVTARFVEIALTLAEKAAG